MVAWVCLIQDDLYAVLYYPYFGSHVVLRGESTTMVCCSGVFSYTQRPVTVLMVSLEIFLSGTLFSNIEETFLH